MFALIRSGLSVALREVPDPVPLSHEALVHVRTFPLLRRELLDLPHLPEGSLLGQDFAGMLVEYPAAIQETAQATPVQGARVVGTVRRGAWAELVAVPYTRLAVIPDKVADVQASALPTAGLAALRALELGGFLVGKRVLVTGARGAVGRLACQLANLAGAEVTGLVEPGDLAARSDRPLDQVPGVVRLKEPPTADYGPGLFDLIVDTVGGDILGEAVGWLEPQGLVVTVATPERDGRISFRTKRADRSAGVRIQFLDDLDEVTANDKLHNDLTRLVALTAEFKLDVGVEVERPWQEAAAVVDGVVERRIRGRAVLRANEPAR